MAYTNIAVVGATGNLGPSIVQALAAANFRITILSQSGKATNLPSSVTVQKVDYTSPESVTAALQGIDALVSMHPKQEEQIPLIDAAIAAGVKRIIPSDFGSDVPGNTKTRDLPFFAGKTATMEYLVSAVGEKISYTHVISGLFLDWGLGVGFPVNVKGAQPPSRIVNGGDARFSTTLLADVGQAVVGVLRNPEATRNRAVRVQSTVTSQNELLEIAERVRPGFRAERVHVTSGEVLGQAYEGLKAGGDRVFPAMMDFILISVVDAEYGSDWSGENDNELLGIKELDKNELERLVKGIA